jgi:hypothetical protein
MAQLHLSLFIYKEKHGPFCCTVSISTIRAIIDAPFLLLLLSNKNINKFCAVEQPMQILCMLQILNFEYGAVEVHM